MEVWKFKFSNDSFEILSLILGSEWHRRRIGRQLLRRVSAPLASISSPNHTKQPKRKKKKCPHTRASSRCFSRIAHVHTHTQRRASTHSPVASIARHGRTSFQILAIFFAPGYDRESIDPEWRARSLASESSTRRSPPRHTVITSRPCLLPSPINCFEEKEETKVISEMKRQRKHFFRKHSKKRSRAC